jgi:hypothetical protein
MSIKSTAFRWSMPVVAVIKRVITAADSPR